MNPNDPLLLLGIAVVSLLYSSVGHGGATGYLALLTFTTIASKEASVLALGMNLAVSGIAFFAFQRAKHFDLSLAWPLLLGSIPFAFIGGKIKLQSGVHEPILAVIFVVVAVLLFSKPIQEQSDMRKAAIPALIAIGAAIGILSGLVGIGGGVFLSPILLLGGYSNAKTTASICALFIFANSFSGLLARGIASISHIQAYWPMVVVGALAAIVGSRLGAVQLPNLALRRLLAVVLLVAAIKAFLK